MLGKKFQKRCDPVQVFWPEWCGWKSFLPLRGPGELKDGSAFVFGHSSIFRVLWPEEGEEDLEEEEEAMEKECSRPSSSELEQNIFTITTRSNPGPSNTEAMSIASQSSQSGETMAGAMPDSPTSAYSSYSTPLESVVDSPQALKSSEPELAYNTPRSNHRTEPVENKARTLRHEKRRL
jgi:hypothetical protein